MINQVHDSHPGSVVVQPHQWTCSGTLHCGSYQQARIGIRGRTMRGFLVLVLGVGQCVASSYWY